MEESDIRILDILSRKLVAKPGEIRAALGDEDSVESSLEKLLSMDCVQVVEPIGEKCYVITLKGSRLLMESARRAGKPQGQGAPAA